MQSCPVVGFVADLCPTAKGIESTCETVCRVEAGRSSSMTNWMEQTRLWSGSSADALTGTRRKNIRARSPRPYAGRLCRPRSVALMPIVKQPEPDKQGNGRLDCHAGSMTPANNMIDALRNARTPEFSALRRVRPTAPAHIRPQPANGSVRSRSDAGARECAAMVATFASPRYGSPRCASIDHRDFCEVPAAVRGGGIGVA